MAVNPFSDGLSVKISARTADFKAGVRSARESLGDLASQSVETSGALQILQGRADEAGDEISSAGRSASGASTTFSGFALSTQGASFAVGTLSTTLTTALIPALAALSTVLVPLAATFGTVALAAGGLVGVFGAIIGSGILAFGEQRAEQNREELRQINAKIDALEEQQSKEAAIVEDQRAHLEVLKNRRERLLDVKATEEGLSESQRQRLQQTREQIKATKETIQANEGLNQSEKQRLSQLKEKKEEVKEQTSITGALGAELKELKNELVSVIVPFGKQFIPLVTAAIDALPTLVENVLEAAGGMSEFTEFLSDFGESAMAVIPEVASALVDLAEDSLPFLRDLGAWLVDVAPKAFRDMKQTVRDVGPELVDLGQTIVRYMPALNEMGKTIIQDLVPAFNDAAPAITSFAKAMGSFLGFVGSVNRMLDNWPVIAALTGLAVVLTGPGGVVAALTAATLWYGKIEDAIFAVQSALKGIDWKSLFDISALLSGALDAVGLSESQKQTLQDLGALIAAPVVNTIDIVGGIVDGLTSIPESLKKEATKLGKDIGQWVEDAAEDAFNFVPDLPSIDDITPGEDGPVERLAFSSSIARSGFSAQQLSELAVAEQGFGGRQITQREARVIERETDLEVQVNVEGDTDVIRNISGEVVRKNNQRQGRNAQAQRTNL